MSALPAKAPANKYAGVASAFRRKDAAGVESVQHSSAARILPAKAGSHPSGISVVRDLAPETLHALVRHHGLDAAADLVAAATPEQLKAVFDIDLWRPSPSGHDQRFDADRFGEWVEALVDADEVLAARTIAGLDVDLVITGLSRYVRVFDPAALLMPVSEEEAADLDLPSFTGLSREVAGYVVRARRTDVWDAIVTLLFALAEHHPDRFKDVMCGCRRLSNSRPEIDGLDDLLIEPEQVLHDAAAERDRRRSQQGYISSADARAFLQMARQRRNLAGVPGAVNPIVAASFRAAAEDLEPVSTSRHEPVARNGSPDAEQRESFEALNALLEDAGLLTARPRGLLPPSQDDSPRPARMEALLRYLAQNDEIALAARSRELAFLANVLAAGCPVQGRAFTTPEASEAAIAVCNLGLEHWPVPDSFLADNDLIAPFEAGWATLHELGMFVATQLIDTLTDLRSVDEEVQAGLQSLRRELLRECGNAKPWRVHTSLEVVAMLDLPVCVSLQAVIAECPVLPEAPTAILERRTRAISPTAFEFISTTRQIQKVRTFASTLLEILMR